MRHSLEKVPARRAGTKAPAAPQSDEAIRVRGARVHNLKNIQVTIPRDCLAVVTGPSGSGKSSLAFDTIYAEGQRRYVESLSVYARQFLEQLERPDVESISGLSPTISIEQRTTTFNPRSTVGTVTEIYDYLRLLYARVAKPFCWKCGDPIRSQSQQQIVDLILSYPDQSRISILAPVVRDRKGEYQKELFQLRSRGFARVRVDGEIRDLSDEIELEKGKRHNIAVYIDRLVMKDDRSQLGIRVSESVELALKLGSGLLVLEVLPPGSSAPTEVLCSQKFACPNCNISYPEPEPRTFSFNSPMGACPDCNGLGYQPKEEASDEDVDPLLSYDLQIAEPPCLTCGGTRLRKESLHFKIGEDNISNLCKKPIDSLVEYFGALGLSERELKIASRILREIRERLSFLHQVGVGYLSLDRSAQTLSGGESQRIRLATQIGSSLVGVIYILDEPSIGLHPRDNQKLLSTLFKLRDLGNTVLVVEHDKDTIEAADWVVDLGPGAGILGGEVVAEGSLKKILASKKSLTGKYLRGDLEISVPPSRRLINPKNAIRVVGATENNLRDLDVSFPLGVFICVTGVSGSGKSSLVIDTLYKALVHHLYKVDTGPVRARSVENLNLVDKIVDVSQSPIGKTPRSNPATYTGIFGLIRDLYSQLPESQVRGYKPGRFSFNVPGGRCEACEGDGVKKIEMHFLPNVYIQCDICKGQRYSRETLDIRYKGKNIAEVLAMSAQEAYLFFDAIPPLKLKLKTINDVGLGYVRLGQTATTLSGGEAQRIKLSKELSRRSTGKSVYILDEPSTGLHFDDVKKLVHILTALVDQGNTVIVIEHNLEIIKVADHLIDLGPEGGSGGGTIIAEGTPEQVAANPKSHTGRFLAPLLQ